MRLLILTLCAFVAGFASGVGLFFGIHGRITPNVVTIRAVEVGNITSTLQSLRAGATNDVADALEGQLDNALVSIWTYYRDTTPSKRDPEVLKILSLAANYRAGHPWRSSFPEVDVAVSGVLRMGANGKVPTNSSRNLGQ